MGKRVAGGWKIMNPDQLASLQASWSGSTQVFKGSIEFWKGIQCIQYLWFSHLTFYSKTCVKWPLSKRPKIGFQDQLALNACQKYFRMLQGEHFAILSTFIKLPFVIKIFVLSFFEWPGITVLTFFRVFMLACLRIYGKVQSVISSFNSWKHIKVLRIDDLVNIISMMLGHFSDRGTLKRNNL